MSTLTLLRKLNIQTSVNLLPAHIVHVYFKTIWIMNDASMNFQWTFHEFSVWIWIIATQVLNTPSGVQQKGLSACACEMIKMLLIILSLLNFEFIEVLEMYPVQIHVPQILFCSVITSFHSCLIFFYINICSSII